MLPAYALVGDPGVVQAATVIPIKASVLTNNTGSSSITFARFEAYDALQRPLEGALERIGLPDATFDVKGSISNRDCSAFRKQFRYA
jgi:hypothetical protein